MGAGAAWSMTTAIDANVIVALWDRDPHLSSAAQSALDAALGRGTLVTTATVFAGLMAGPSRSESFLDSFFREPASALTGPWVNRFGGQPAGPSRVTLPVEGNNETRAHAAFWQTS